MIVIAHGQPKSGSTFLYMTAQAIAEHVNGEGFHPFMYRVLGSNFNAFQNEVPASLIVHVDKAVGPERMFIIKTHGKLTEDVAELIAAGQVKAFTSFRDPRDTALSTLNVGESDRAKGVDRWFSTITEMKQLVRPIKSQTVTTFAWARHPDVLAIPYYLTALSQAASVGLIARHLGVRSLQGVLGAEMEAKRRSLPEFNKGVLDRFVEDLSVKDIRFCSDVWADIIAEYESLLKTTMTRLGYRLAYRYYAGLRDARLRERLAELKPARF